MISKLHRFHGFNALRGVYKNGRTVRGAVISLKYTRRQGKPHRIAVVVSKKVHKSAVVRNRIRRRIFEICRKQTDVDLSELDLVITVFNDQLARQDSEKLESQVLGLLKKIVK